MEAPKSSELIARELAFEAMKWLVLCGGDASRLSELGRAALAWADTEPDASSARLPRPAGAEGGRESAERRFVRNTAGRVWVTRPILRARGWTNASIRDFLREPEGYKPNPRFAGSGHPMPVWQPETVAEAEAAPEWQRWLQKSLHRRRTNLREVAATQDADFRRRLEAVQAAIDAYLEAQVRRGSASAVRKDA